MDFLKFDGKFTGRFYLNLATESGFVRLVHQI